MPIVGPAGGGGGGGSNPGALQSADIIFTEDDTATLYTATLPVAAGTVVMDVLVTSLAGPWSPSGGSATLTVGDTANPNGFMQEPLETLAVYDPTAPVIGTNYETTNDDGDAYYGVGLLAITLDGGSGTAGPGVRYATDDTITVKVTVTGTPATDPTGVTLVKVLYFAPVTALTITKS